MVMAYLAQTVTEVSGRLQLPPWCWVVSIRTTSWQMTDRNRCDGCHWGIIPSSQLFHVQESQSQPARYHQVFEVLGWSLLWHTPAIPWPGLHIMGWSRGWLIIYINPCPPCYSPIILLGACGVYGDSDKASQSQIIRYPVISKFCDIQHFSNWN